ncbi:MAG: type II toxin-antitoxin system VapC family toxin [Chitinophagales bacterium]
MTDTLLIDTDVLIDFSRGIEKAKSKIKTFEVDHTLSVSVVTQLELMVGCENKADFKALQKFLNNFDIILINHAVSERSVQLFEKYRLSHGVQIADMLIAATAIEYDLALLTKNQKDFRFIKDLKLLKY